MYVFAVIALLALGVVKLVDALMEFTGSLDHKITRSILTFGLAVGGIYIMDFNMFTEWGMSLRTTDIGIVMTGLVIAGMTTAWRTVFSYLTHHVARPEDAANYPELRKVS